MILTKNNLVINEEQIKVTFVVGTVGLEGMRVAIVELVSETGKQDSHNDPLRGTLFVQLGAPEDEILLLEPRYRHVIL